MSRIRRERRRNRTAPRTRPRAAARRARRNRLLAGAVLLVLLVIPAVRRAALAGWSQVQGALAAARAGEAREREIRRFAQRYGISPQMAEAVHRTAREEGVAPELAFRLVRVESAFYERAVSSAGALGLTQLMPATAAELQPGITREELFRRETNLRLGFRYYRRLLRYYDGDTEAALHAYNRGLGTVDRIRAKGGDPANGYAARVLGSPGASRVRPGSPAAHPADSLPLHEMAPARLDQGR